MRILGIFKKKSPPAPLQLEDSFLQRYRCAADDWESIAAEQVRADNLAKKARKKARRRRRA